MELTDTNQPCGLSIFFDFYSTDYPTIQLSLFLYVTGQKTRPALTGNTPPVAAHGHLTGFYGGHSKEDPPVPIPNTEVKLFCADGTARATVWESRTPPFFYTTKAPDTSVSGAFVVCRCQPPFGSAASCRVRSRHSKVSALIYLAKRNQFSYILRERCWNPPAIPANT
jgi:hypothetical protein